MRLYRSLEDNFLRHDGSLSDYVQHWNALEPNLTPNTHYDLRAFHSESITVPWTMIDMRFWNAYYFAGKSMDYLGSPRTVGGRTYRHRTQTDLDGIEQSVLNTMSQFELDHVVLTLGNEEWPLDDPDVTIGRDSTLEYANVLAITVHPGSEKVVSSYYNDDIVTDFEAPFVAYTIRSTFTGLPTQASPDHLDLNNSFIEISSDLGFDPSVTDNIAFSSMVSQDFGTGMTSFEFDRSLLVNADLQNLKALRFRLNSVGTNPIVVKALAIKLLASGYLDRLVDLDTKVSHLSKAVPSGVGTLGAYGDGAYGAGAYESLVAEVGPIFFGETSPKNLIYTIRLDTGHHPSGANNSIDFFARYNTDTGDHIRVSLISNQAESRLFIYESIGDVEREIYSTPPSTNVLLETHILDFVITIQEGLVKAEIWDTIGVLRGSLVYSTDWQSVNRRGRGKVGYDFEPFNYDFTIHSVGAQETEFATYESVPTAHLTPIRGLSLNAINSGPDDLLEDSTFEAFGDATLSIDTITGNPAPSTKTVRLGNQWFGGKKQVEVAFLGDSRFVAIVGSIYPVAVVRGLYRLALVDGNGSVSWIGYIRELVANRWNQFRVHINRQLPPSNYSLILHQTGFYDDTYYVDDLKIEHPTIDWRASPDEGETWYKFFDAINSKYSGVKFDAPSVLVKIQAIALSDQAWIGGEYEWTPHYSQVGHKLV